MSDTKAEREEKARLIADWLKKLNATKHGMPLKVGHIATRDCPVKAPAHWHSVGGEAHCQRVTRALNTAVRLGLVEKVRNGEAGPWLYYALEDAA